MKGTWEKCGAQGEGGYCFLGGKQRCSYISRDLQKARGLMKVKGERNVKGTEPRGIE